MIVDGTVRVVKEPGGIAGEDSQPGRFLERKCKKTRVWNDLLLDGAKRRQERLMPDWQEILVRDGPAAWQTAYRLLGNRADADDCFQEACLAAVDVSRRELVHNWRGLLQRLATLRAMDRLRSGNRARRQQPLPRWDELPDRSPDPVQHAEEAELAHELRLALAQLPAKQAEVFCLHCLEDWSYDEIARHARMTVTSVGVYLHRARKRLRELLGHFQHGNSAAVRLLDRGGDRQAADRARKEQIST